MMMMMMRVVAAAWLAGLQDKIELTAQRSGPVQEGYG
jgi:hypothetical protein